MTSDFDDLLGLTPKRGPNAPPAAGKRRRGRPTKGEAAAHAAKKAAELAAAEPDDAVAGVGANAMPDATAFHRPVTRTFLAEVLGMEPRRLTRRLAACPVIGYKPGKAHGEAIPLYDFKEAVRYTVPPASREIADWIQNASLADLPPNIGKAFWDAMRSKQMVQERARNLWRTEDVLDVLGRTALNIKDTVKLWIENLPNKAALTSEQYAALQRETDGLLDAVHHSLVTMAQQRQTPSSLADVEADSRSEEVEGEDA